VTANYKTKLVKTREKIVMLRKVNDGQQYVCS